MLIIGDTHGKNQELLKMLILFDILNDSIIHVGDFAAGFNHWHVAILNEFLKSRKSMMYIVRGNHDKSQWFNGLHNLSNIIFVSNTIIEIDQKKILTIGGAVSIDREYRKAKGMFWDENEKIVPFDYSNMTGIDMVISHSAPSCAPPMNTESLFAMIKMGMMKLDLDDDTTNNLSKSLYSDINYERYYLNQVFTTLIENGNNIKYWLYGHFHKSSTAYIHDTKFQCLKELEMIEIR